MGNANVKTSSAHVLNGDITRQDIIENMASVLEHLVCSSGFVTFKAIHCPNEQEKDHEQRKCGIFITGSIFAHTPCKKLSNLQIFSTNFTTCPPASITQLFVDGVKNIPNLKSIELIGCTFSEFSLYTLFVGIATRPSIAHLQFRGGAGFDRYDERVCRILSDPSQIALKFLSLTSTDITPQSVEKLGHAMQENPNFRASTFVFGPPENGPPEIAEQALVAAFTHILPVVECFQVINCSSISSDHVADSLIVAMKSSQFSRRYKLNLCLFGFSVEKHQEILYAIADSTISKLQILLKQEIVDTGSLDAPLAALVESKNLEHFNFYISNAFPSDPPPLPTSTCEAIATALCSPSCKLRTVRFPLMAGDGAAHILEALKRNSSLRHLLVDIRIPSAFLIDLMQILEQKQNLTISRFQPILYGFEQINNFLDRNETFYYRKMASLTQLCFQCVGQHHDLEQRAKAVLPKDLRTRMLQFNAWKRKRDKPTVSALSGLLPSPWELISSDELEWYPVLNRDYL